MAATAASMMHCSVMVSEARSSVFVLPSELTCDHQDERGLSAFREQCPDMLKSRGDIEGLCSFSPPSTNLGDVSCQTKDAACHDAAVLTNTFRDSDFITKNAARSL